MMYRSGIARLLFLFMSAVGLQAVEKGPRPNPLSSDPVTVSRFMEALELHQDAVIQAQSILEELLVAAPDDVRVQAFLGNLYAMRARDAYLLGKMKWLRRSTSTLDKAVAAAPDDVTVRSVRAVNSYKLPKMCGRWDVAEEDFGVLLDWAESDPSRYSDSLLRFVYFHAGQFWGEEDDAKAQALFEQALAVPGDSVSDEEIREAMEEL